MVCTLQPGNNEENLTARPGLRRDYLADSMPHLRGAPILHFRSIT
jgi:hypothetical protein